MTVAGCAFAFEQLRSALESLSAGMPIRVCGAFRNSYFFAVAISAMLTFVAQSPSVAQDDNRDVLTLEYEVGAPGYPQGVGWDATGDQVTILFGWDGAAFIMKPSNKTFLRLFNETEGAGSVAIGGGDSAPIATVGSRQARSRDSKSHEVLARVSPPIPNCFFAAESNSSLITSDGYIWLRCSQAASDPNRNVAAVRYSFPGLNDGRTLAGTPPASDAIFVASHLQYIQGRPALVAAHRKRTPEWRGALAFDCYVRCIFLDSETPCWDPVHLKFDDPSVGFVIHSLRLSRDGRQIAVDLSTRTSGGEGFRAQVAIFDVTERIWSRLFEPDLEYDLGPAEVSFLGQGRYLVVGFPGKSKGAAVVFDIARGKTVQQIPLKGPMRVVGSPDERRVLLTSRDSLMVFALSARH